ncbi:FUSC family protein [uncultured Clostridium sp.]|uniref:FUSC family protein n=1 Tax=uncultured Clostridium sp. TaxID=59620 RepID=UPI0026385D92|nr:FUSC family protein [uncultured Clostridium sp.]
MNKKNIVNNTILFVVIIAFINIFNMMFGDINSVVGVTVITSGLILLQRDLTGAPVENLINLIAINLFTGIFAYIASINLWIGIPINFIALFVVGYFFSSNLKEPVVIGFGLQYLFMLFTPVSGREFGLRLISLVFGAFFIMGLQLLANKNKLKKSFKSIFVGVLSDLISSLESEAKVYDSATEKINKLKKIVYEGRKKSFYLCDEGKRVTNIIYLLERLNIIFENKEDIQEGEFNKHVSKCLLNLKIGIENNDFSEIHVAYFEREISKENVRVIKSLKGLVDECSALSKVDSKVSLQVYNIPEKFKTIKVMKDNFSLESLKVSYALRLAIIGTISIFIVDFFKIPQGKWMVYTVFSLTQPYAESSKIRTRQRVEGTIIGAFIVLVAFTFIQDGALRGLVILLAGYLNPYAKDYKKVMILVTVSAVAAAAIEGGAIEFIMQRVLFVIAGALLAMLASKFIIPYHLKDGNDELKLGYLKVIKTMKEDIIENKDDNIVKSLYLLPAFLEDKFKSTNIDEKELELLAEFADKKRRAINEVYSIYYFMDGKENKELEMPLELVME